MTGWKQYRLDWLAQEERNVVDPKNLRDETVFHYSIPVLDESGDGRYEPTEALGSGKLVLRGGEVLISKLNPRLPRVIEAAAHEVVTVASTEFIALRPGPRLDRRFLRYWLCSEWVRQLLNGATISVTRSQQRIRPEVLTHLWARFPSTGIQRAIADYLDTETARIDALIEKKRRMVELVEERQGALVSLVSRRGVTADRVRADSRPWIVEVPISWDVLPLKRIGNLQAGAAFPDSYQGQLGELIPYFKVSDFETPGNEKVLCYGQNTVAKETARLLRSPVLPAGTIVFPKIGAALLSNRRRLLSIDSCVDQNVMGLTVTRGVPWFFYYLLKTLDFGTLRMPGPVPLLNERDAADLPVPVPPLDEQRRIVDYLDNRLRLLDEAASRLADELELLQEHRQALITAAVTGELEIPGAAA